ncbi:hypothetical protein [Paenibacillus macquariensis]|uniref:Heat induced stress protein YflT n=1 Tax=Paenibacillus macquariensis TaxID=948756 RepID=A0ABY1K1X0_9BACL|nr:hypothetical protein [Paenibacillus macquariensis]MEC0091666.1 hypothetical protein [Paenibacillus macquariensis]OAB32404.1 hypothetical protein PMSM_17530 [Paenibacillus macquariensis subsp. macquariensis]SIR14416.1 hypothetical protein SAMN05421578_107256 [Paenibacillus macquariensis]
MSKQIQAYFQTEDQAEGAKTTLLTYKTEHLEVSKLAEAIDRDNHLLFPLVGINTSGNINTSGAVGIMGAGGIAGINIVPTLDNNDVETDKRVESHVNDEGKLGNAAEVTSDNIDHLNYVLVAKVQAEHYNEIVQMLREHHAYVEKLD